MMNAEWWMMMDDEWSRPSCVTESTEFVHITRGKTSLIASWLFNRKHSSSSKCSTEKSYQFISKVSQKLDYCVSTHTRIPSQPRCVTESTESVHDVVTSKKTRLNHSPSQPRESNFCDTFENHVTLNSFISQKERLNSSQPSCVTESTELDHITRGKTELIPSWLCNRKHSSSSKCSTEKSHQFISKV